MSKAAQTLIIFFVGIVCEFTLMGLQSALAQHGGGIDIEKPPFEYSKTVADNSVSRLISKIQAKEVKLEYARNNGFLRSLLKNLDIPESSQTLVFSKTSLQASRISRQNPRALYFNDDVYVGWVRGSTLMEISTTDAKLGAVFYTVDMKPWRADIQRTDYDCLGCHATSMTRGVPGHAVRSVTPNFDGSVDPQIESFVTIHSSPFTERWGGWYVTGLPNSLQHMGNTFMRSGKIDTRKNENRIHLKEDFDTVDYLSPYSDIVALMVLNHQAEMHNIFTQANFTIRKMAYERSKEELSTEEQLEADSEWKRQMEISASQIVDGLLFCDEAPLFGAGLKNDGSKPEGVDEEVSPEASAYGSAGQRNTPEASAYGSAERGERTIATSEEIRGTTEFAEQFAGRGHFDSHGRSLREFDLKARMFRYPCSYLIYSSAFNDLHRELKDEVIRQITSILESKNDSARYDHLTSKMRSDILEILKDTKDDFRDKGITALGNVE